MEVENGVAGPLEQWRMQSRRREGALSRPGALAPADSGDSVMDAFAFCMYPV